MISESEYQDLRDRLRSDFNPLYAGSTTVQTVDSLASWKKQMMADGSLGRLLTGPQWLDGVAIRDGQISGSKLKATLVISNTFVTADTTVTPTADRMEMTSAGIKAYGTVAAVANTQTVSIGSTGDFTFGDAGHNPITYVASTGTLTVPAAVIGSLTIANVGAGIIGGLYKSSSANAHLELDTAGIRFYNTSAVKTIDMLASDGSITITGTFTAQSATSGARVELKDTGVKIYDGTTLRAQMLATGAGFVGSTDGTSGNAAMSWTTAGLATINASRITTGTLDAGSVTISSLTIGSIGTGVIGGAYSTAATNQHIKFSTSGIVAYKATSETTANETVRIDAATGDFTFGDNAHNQITYVASTGALTVPAATIGSLTIANVAGGVLGGAYKTASGTGARLEFDTSGLRAYNSSNTKTFDAVASTGALSLTGTLTVGSGGKINFGASSADYLDNNLLHFEVTSTETADIEYVNSSNAPRGRILGAADVNTSSMSLNTNYDGSFNSDGTVSSAPVNRANMFLSSALATESASLVAHQSNTSDNISRIDLTGSSTAATTSLIATVGKYGSLTMDNVSGTYARLTIAGRFYPGSDTSTQTTRYISDDGTNINVNANLKVNDTLIWTGAGSPQIAFDATYGLRASGGIYFGSLCGFANTGAASGTMPSATKALQVYDSAGNVRYIPLYTATGGWAA